MIVSGSCNACEVRLDGKKAVFHPSGRTLFRASNLDPAIPHRLRVTKNHSDGLLLVDEVKLAFV